MLKRINSILFVSGFILFLSGCSSSKVPVSYSYNKRELRKEITGSWTEVKLNPTDTTGQKTAISGELIAIQSDTVYILTSMGLQGIHEYNINEAVVYMYRNQAGMYATITLLLYIPDIVAAIITGYPYFLLIGLPWIVMGSTIALIETSNQSNLLNYPFGNQFQELKKFARFPQGIPPGIDKSRLHLITRK
jgi:hypothetical protein